MPPVEATDVIVIGAGIAGASIAAEIAAGSRVLLLERERQPGYHTTGRSAALFTETYGSEVKRALSRASRTFLQQPAAGVRADAACWRRAERCWSRRESQVAKLRQTADDCAGLVGNLAWLTEDEVRARVACFAPGQVAAGLLEPDAMDIDVDALHRGYLRLLAARGGTLVNNAEVRALDWAGGAWRASTSAGEFRAGRVVNAAGAWADEIGKLAGAKPIGLVPMRRTAITFDPPAGVDIGRWPAVFDVDEQWYFKPDAGRILASPADETPSAPCDAQPDEYDVAVVVDRLSRATTLAGAAHRRALGGAAVVRRGPAAGGRIRSARPALLLAGRAGRSRHPDLARRVAHGGGAARRRAGAGGHRRPRRPRRHARADPRRARGGVAMTD